MKYLTAMRTFRANKASLINNIILVAGLSWLASICHASNPSQSMQAELYRQGYRAGKGIISSNVVSSRMQCMHRCRQADQCQGMNIKDADNDMQCELTSTRVDDDNEDEVLVEGDRWEFHRVVSLVKYAIKVVSHGQTKDPPKKVSSFININGKKFQVPPKGDDPGFLVVAFDYNTGLPGPLKEKWFARGVGDHEVKEFLKDIQNGMIVVVCVTDTARESNDGPSPIDELKTLGATELDNVKYRSPYCLITRKGDAPSWKKEVFMPKESEPSKCDVVIY